MVLEGVVGELGSWHVFRHAEAKRMRCKPALDAGALEPSDNTLYDNVIIYYFYQHSIHESQTTAHTGAATAPACAHGTGPEAPGTATRPS